MHTPATKARPRLFYKLLAFALLTILPSSLIGAMSVFAMDEFIGQHVQSLARSAHLQVERSLLSDLEHARKQVSTVVTSLRAQRARGVALEDLRPPDTPLSLHAIVSLRDGHRVLWSAHLPASVGDVSAFPAPREAEGFGYLKEWVAGNPPTEVLSILHTIRVDDEFLVYGGFPLNRQRLRDLALLTQSEIRIVAGEETLEAAATNVAQPVQTEETGLPIAGMRGGPALRLSTRIDVGPLLDGRASLVRRIVAISLGAFVLSILISWLLSRTVTLPLEALADATAEVSQGRFAPVLETGRKDEIGELLRGFNQMMLDLESSRTQLARAERLAAWRDVARQVAHEIKNPLFPIQTSMETVEKAFRLDHPRRMEILKESVRTVLEEVSSLNRIVTEFSDFARMPRPILAPVKPAALLERLERLYREQAGTGQLRIDLTAAPLEIMADAEQLFRALSNLTKNAFEASPDAMAVVSVEVRKQSFDNTGWVVFRVTDTGSGIAPGDVERIFTPYFTKKESGTGLGLPIVDRIATEHGGHLRLESTGPDGTTFILQLPC